MDRLRRDGADSRVGVRRGARHEERLAVPDDPFGDRRDLGRSFAYAKDNLGEPLADRAVGIDAREAEILERRGTQRLQQAGRCRCGINGSGTHVVEEPLKLVLGHIAYNPHLC
ncbi:hypothetical protein D3C83_18400 [compost metagenome]